MLKNSTLQVIVINKPTIIIDSFVMFINDATNIKLLVIILKDIYL